MILPDVNVLVYAFREDSADHDAYRAWLTTQLAAPEPYAVSELVLASFLRIVTNRRIYQSPSPLESAMAFATVVRDRPNAAIVRPGPRHWEIFEDLITRTRTTGSRVTDAYLAALAVESDAEFVTADRDFSRFPGLRWRHPLQAA